MIWNVIFPVKRTVLLPHYFNADTMFAFLAQVVDEQRDAKCSTVVFDFARLSFVEPVGVVVLSNVIEYFRQLGCKVLFKNHTMSTGGVRFLDDALFFERYLGERVFPGSSPRSTTIPLGLIHSQRAQEYLLHTLMPWVGNAVGLTPESLAGVRVSLEEVLHNVRDHSGVSIGCTFAQHFPQRNRIQIAISDFGSGIPNVVRTKRPDTGDAAALRLACMEGFTTQSNVQNRGAGLPTLIRYVTQNNGGNVLIAAGEGALSAAPTPNGLHPYKITTRTAGFYPGTLVRVILRTDTLDRAAEDAVVESFKW
ncbi:histidine kinase [Roseateles cavernae]|uniref:histidine kinase n=1 Tax=Roseateles cavernae TaxID=3153578 RepID=UPI0032E4B7D5